MASPYVLRQFDSPGAWNSNLYVLPQTMTG